MLCLLTAPRGQLGAWSLLSHLKAWLLSTEAISPTLPAGHTMCLQVVSQGSVMLSTFQLRYHFSFGISSQRSGSDFLGHRSTLGVSPPCP